MAATNPEFPGGMEALNALVKQQVNYPEEAKERGIGGKCYLRFVVEADGSISNVIVTRGVPDCRECDKEVVRFMKTMPNWIPGTYNGKPVGSTMNTFILFALQ